MKKQHTEITCNECGWFIINPRPELALGESHNKKKNKRRRIMPEEKGDIICPNCGKLYEETNSKIQIIKEEE